MEQVSVLGPSSICAETEYAHHEIISCLILRVTYFRWCMLGFQADVR